MQQTVTLTDSVCWRLHRLERCKGFTLVEIIVSFVILAILSTSVFVAVSGLVSMQKQDDIHRRDNSAAELSIATGEEPSQKDESLELSLGGYSLSSSADTHENGTGQYTVLNPGSGPDPDDVTLDGDEGFVLEYQVIKTGYYQLEVWGASGGDGTVTNNNSPVNASTLKGGAGGYSSGIVHLNKGDTLYLHAGGTGQSGLQHLYLSGGVNGGGDAKPNLSSSSQTHRHGSGGGASDVRINTDSLHSRVIVAGGGGGSGGSYNKDYAIEGGFAGGLQGETPRGTIGNIRTSGGGGTQSAGGIGGLSETDTPRSSGEDGSFGLGGYSGTRSGNVFDSGGGGGGWYGGGGGGAGGPGGGGGSSWVYTAQAYSAWTNAVDKNNYMLDSSYYLQNSILIQGNANMPNPRNNDVSMVGMRGNGYVRLSWVGISVQ